MRNTSLISTIKHFLTLKRHRPRRPQSPAASSGLAPSPKRGFSAPSAPAALSSDAPPAALRLAQRSAAPPRPRSHPRRASPGTLRAPPRPSAQADLPRGMLRFAEGRKEGRAVEGRGPTGAIPCLRHSRTAPPGAAHPAPHRGRQVRPATRAGANPARGPPKRPAGRTSGGAGQPEGKKPGEGNGKRRRCAPAPQPRRPSPPRAEARSDAQRARGGSARPSALPADLKPRTARRSRCASPPAAPLTAARPGRQQGRAGKRGLLT